MKQETINKYKSFGLKGLTKRFKMACLSGNLDIISYMLTSKDLKENIDIHTADDFAFRMACKRGYLNIVQYLLSSPELVEYADIHVYKNIAFRQAQENGHNEIVKYLLSFKLEAELKEHFNKPLFKI